MPSFPWFGCRHKTWSLILDSKPWNLPNTKKRVASPGKHSNLTNRLAPNEFFDQSVRQFNIWPHFNVDTIVTDSIGRASDNQLLLERRAGAVRQYLLEWGINPSRIIYQG